MSSKSDVNVQYVKGIDHHKRKIYIEDSDAVYTTWSRRECMMHILKWMEEFDVVPPTQVNKSRIMLCHSREEVRNKLEREREERKGSPKTEFSDRFVYSAKLDVELHPSIHVRELALLAVRIFLLHASKPSFLDV